MRPWSRWSQKYGVLALCVLLASSMAAVVWWLSARERGPLPLSASLHLREVVEPITLEWGMAIDDGGSQELSFRDSRGRRIAFSLVCFDLREWGSNKPHQVAFDVGGEERFVPVGGPDERALLGLLERWAESAGVGQGLVDRYRRYVRREIDVDAFTQGRGNEPFWELVAHGVLRQLRNR